MVVHLQDFNHTQLADPLFGIYFWRNKMEARTTAFYQNVNNYSKIARNANSTVLDSPE